MKKPSSALLLLSGIIIAASNTYADDFPSPVVPVTERIVLQWQRPDAARPWLKTVDIVVYSGEAAIESRALPETQDEYPLGLETVLAMPPGDKAPVWLQVRLANGYGFTVSREMLRDHPYIWVKDMGIYLSREGWASTAHAREAAAQRISASRAQPFASTAERYTDWSRFTEHEPDDLHKLAWQFIDAKHHWPEEARVAERIATLPEVDASYFAARVPDYTRAKMFLGWPDHNDQFTLWSHGRVTVSSQSVGGDPRMTGIPWHPRAEAYGFQYAIGASALPRYREYGDPDVRQRLADGHNLAVVSAWDEDGFRMEQTCFAAPRDIGMIRTGLEPLLLWSRLDIKNLDAAAPRDGWLGVEFSDEDFVTFMNKNPLADAGRISWRDGAFYAGGRLLAVTDPALVFERLPSYGPVSRFRAKISLPAGGKRSFALAHLYRLETTPQPPRASVETFETAHSRMIAHWEKIAAAGASVRVPDEWLNNLYRTFLPRILINSHLDPDGHPVMHTGPIQYSRVWHHITALGIGGDLARRGQFEECRRHLDTFFRWQSTPAPDSPAITDWNGFFGAPPVQCAKVWLSYHGAVLWAMARYYELSGDRAWAEEKMPAIIQGMDWIVRNRRTTKRLNPDGSKPFNYGWLPPGRVHDSGAGDTNSIYSDASAWQGMSEMAAVLRKLNHPRAPDYQAEADDYRLCIQDGQRRSSAIRPLLRLNDGTWVPYMPAELDSKGNERDPKSKYASVVDAAWAWGILDSAVFGRGAPETNWVLSALEDLYAILNPGLPDEPFTSGSLNEYLDADQIENFLYTFYSQSTTTLDRETLTTIEHRSWGQKRAFELTPWAAGYWTANFTNMLCRTVGDELWLLQATPRRWLADGETIEVKNLQTEFGPVSFQVRSHLAKRRIDIEVQPPVRETPSRLRLRLRVPAGHMLRAVTVNGQAWRDFDPAGGWINLPSRDSCKIEARY